MTSREPKPRLVDPGAGFIEAMGGYLAFDSWASGCSGPFGWKGSREIRRVAIRRTAPAPTARSGREAAAGYSM